MTLQIHCPHCGASASPAPREFEDKPGAPVTDPVIEWDCLGCGAYFEIRMSLTAKPRVSSMSRIAVGVLRKEATDVVKQIRRARKQPETPPPVSCPGCYQEFGEASGYPTSLASFGLCAVCQQEAKRILARRSS